VTVPYSFAHNAFAATLQSSYDHLADGEESVTRSRSRGD